MKSALAAVAAKKLYAVVGTLSIACMATAGSAATVQADFDLRAGGSATNQAALNYSASGVDLVVTGIVCGDSRGPNHSSCSAGDIDRSSSSGIYFRQPNDSDHEVDGQYSNEFLKFSFNPDVSIKSIRFSYWDDNDNARFYTDNAGTWQQQVNIGTNSSTYNFSTVYTGGMFLLGARDSNDDWKVKKVSVTYEMSAVPLPAAGWMLVAGLGAFGALRRRRK